MTSRGAEQHAVLSICRAISTSTWSDALDRLRIGGAVRGLAWRTGAGRFAGRAFTVRGEVAALGGSPLSDFKVGVALRSVRSGQVLVFDLGGAEVSTFGGLAATQARTSGVDGVVVDGGCRDLDELRASGLGVVSRWVTPISGKERVRLTAFGVPVTCGGVTVSQDDFVIADETGTVIVPADRFDETLGLAQRLHEQDRRFREGLDAGESFDQVAARLGHV